MRDGLNTRKPYRSKQAENTGFGACKPTVLQICHTRKTEQRATDQAPALREICFVTKQRAPKRPS